MQAQRGRRGNQSCLFRQSSRLGAPRAGRVDCVSASFTYSVHREHHFHSCTSGGKSVFWGQGPATSPSDLLTWCDRFALRRRASEKECQHRKYSSCHSAKGNVRINPVSCLRDLKTCMYLDFLTRDERHEGRHPPRRDYHDLILGKV